ncbi:MAG: two-component system, NtrC family, sensor kinase [Proteobacteria bacterium]|nr:two-component system, NtrC family, sensor kinase [Pseudomonadota bacterium]
MSEDRLHELAAENIRLKKMVSALMDRAEQGLSADGSGFSLFETTIMLERQIKARTQALEVALHDNEQINRALLAAKQQLEQEKDEQSKLIDKLAEIHSQLLQAEKLASIGQLAAGVAHEINNPIGFVNSNLGTLKGYVADLLGLIDAYQAVEEQLPDSPQKDILAAERQRVDLAFLRQDVVDLLAESIDGAGRVRHIVQDLRDFSRTGEVSWEAADLHAGLDSTLNLLASELRDKAEIVREYGELPRVECIPSQINQVFMNLLGNAAHAIAGHGTITLRSGCAGDQVWISVTDTGAGIAADHLAKIFDPFFTTRPVGKGSGLGLSMAYRIVDQHHGRIDVSSQPGQGSCFTIWLPIRQQAA